MNTNANGFSTSVNIQCNGLTLGSYTLSSLSANNEVPNSLDWNGNAFSSYLNQGVLTSSTPIFAGLTVSDATVNQFVLESSGVGSQVGMFWTNSNSGAVAYFGLVSTIGQLYTASPIGTLVIRCDTGNIAFSHSGTLTALLDTSGDLVTVGYCASANYLSGAYGATWGSLPSFPTAVNGNYYVLYDTTTATSRIYCYSNNGWHWSALT
jgi:hypothetical protein